MFVQHLIQFCSSSLLSSPPAAVAVPYLVELVKGLLELRVLQLGEEVHLLLLLRWGRGGVSPHVPAHHGCSLFFATTKSLKSTNSTSSRHSPDPPRMLPQSRRHRDHGLQQHLHHRQASPITDSLSERVFFFTACTRPFAYTGGDPKLPLLLLFLLLLLVLFLGVLPFGRAF